MVEEEVAERFRARGFPVKDTDDGAVVIIKRKVNGPNGMIRQAPKLLDKSKTPIDIAVGNGSKVKVQCKEWESAWNGTTYKGLDFQAMQVLELVEYGQPDGAEFGIEEEAELEEL